MSLWTAYSVNPDAVTLAQIAEVCAELGVDTDAPIDGDFFQSGATYRRNGDTFRCVAVGIRDEAYPAAIGYLPINLAAGPTWEFAAMTSWEWRRGWTAASPTVNDTINPGKES